MKKILVLGYFGYVDNQLDGQTIKTRNIYELLKSKETEIKAEVKFFDTQSFKKSKLNLIRMLYSLSKANEIYYLGAHSNLKFLFPFIFLLSKLVRANTHFVVVGGWLVEFLKNKPLHRVMLKNISSIYPQTQLMVTQLHGFYGFKNVHQLYNFRMEKIVDIDSLPAKNDDVKKLVFMARVHPMKGIETVFKLASALTKKNDKSVQVDVYGPIYQEYEQSFYKSINEHKGVVYYKGVLEPNKITQTLSEYDAMLFPTRYFTEGFPGTILDSFIAGLPVIASNWKYAEEYINPRAGVITRFDDEVDFVNATLSLINDDERLDKMRLGALKEAEKYTSEAAWKTLRSNFSL